MIFRGFLFQSSRIPFVAISIAICNILFLTAVYIASMNSFATSKTSQVDKQKPVDGGKSEPTIQGKKEMNHE